MKPPTPKQKTEKEFFTAAASKPVTSKCALEFNPQDYAHYLSSMDLTPEQQDELIRVTANIMMAFVDMGFGISPNQCAIDPETCAQEDDLSRIFPLDEEDMLYLGDPEHEELNEHAAYTFAALEGESS